MAKNWISLHVFYAGSPEPLLTEAIEPLIDTFREQGLIQRHFFIRYWQEGPHVRLRLLPVEDVDDEKVKRLAEETLSTYVKQHPSLYTSEGEGQAAFYKTMFISEYSAEKWAEVYGDQEQMPIRPNNSLHFIPYDPEYGRYGGPYGMELAEWHFEKSSELVFQLIRTTNVHLRSIMLGLSVQLALPLCLELLGDEQEVVIFLKRYERFWKEHYMGGSVETDSTFEKKFGKMAPSLLRRLAHVENMVRHDEYGEQDFFEQEWIAHVRELKVRIDHLIAERKLIFQSSLTDQKLKAFDDPIYIYNLLLSSYIHMTNNRLGTMIPDEIYLAYLMRRTLEENILLKERENVQL